MRRHLEHNDFGAQSSFDWLRKCGPAKIATVAWAASSAAFVLVVCYDFTEGDEVAEQRTMLSDMKAALRSTISQSIATREPEDSQPAERSSGSAQPQHPS